MDTVVEQPDVRSGQDPPPKSKRSPSPASLLGIVLFPSLIIATLWHATQEPRIVQAHDAYQRAEYLEALRLAEDVLEDRPWRDDARRIAALSLSQLVYGARAETYYQDLRRNGQLSRDDLEIRAFGLAQSNLQTEAIQAYDELIVQDPDDPMVLRRFAALLYTWGDTRHAKMLALRLAENPEHRPIALAMLGRFYYETDDLVNCEWAYSNLLEIDPDLVELPPNIDRIMVFRRYAESVVGVERYDKAVERVTPWAQLTDDPRLLDLLGLAHRRLGNVERGCELWRRSIKKRPNRLFPRLQLGRTYIQEGRIDEAMDQLDQALTIDPSSAFAWYQLSLAHKIRGDRQREREALERFNTLRREQPQTGGMGFLPESLISEEPQP